MDATLVGLLDVREQRSGFDLKRDADPHQGSDSKIDVAQLRTAPSSDIPTQPVGRLFL